jgi:membrane-associated protease RseP (regulator of RpoE activity)
MRSLATAICLLALLGGCDAREQAAAEADAAAWTDFGLQVQDLPDSARSALGLSHGVMVIRVRAPADRTRILPGDVIVSVDQTEVRSAEEFGRLAERGRGAVGVVVRRSDADLFITLPEPRPASPGPSRRPTGTPQRT